MGGIRDDASFTIHSHDRTQIGSSGSPLHTGTSMHSGGVCIRCCADAGSSGAVYIFYSGYLADCGVVWMGIEAFTLP